jgi:hypothetical protein
MRVPSFVVFCLLATAAGAQEAVVRSQYRNERWGTILDLPPGFQVAAPSSEPDDRRTFRDAAGAEISVFASRSPSAAGKSFAEYRDLVLRLAAETEAIRITYQAGGRDWFVFSGLRGETIVYVRVINRCGAAHHVRIAYPAALKARYEAIDQGIARGLRCRGPAPSPRATFRPPRPAP